ncbi:MAG TPA: hypothetical protein VL490_00900 [Mucilaginibacter sp.]|jgi:hypothetical protein|nr:hypothetical protein [Mucilaginibacter sp.]
MDNKTDNELKKRISEVFDNFDDQTAHEGWLLLREKYPKKNRRVIAWYWWGMAAAVLLLFFGISLFNNHTETKTKKLSNNVIKQQNIITDKQQATHTSAKQPATIPHTLVNIKKEPVNKESPYITVATDQHVPVSVLSKDKLTAQNEMQPIAAQATAKDKDSVAVKADAAVAAEEQHADANGINGLNNIMRKPATPAHKPDAIMDDYPGSKSPTPANKSVRFGIYAATFFNYAKGSSNQVNVGAGITADISISSNLTLSTGVALAQNTLTYGNLPTQSAHENYVAVIPPPAANSIGGLTGGQSYDINHYNASLVALDIPINLKFEFNPDKHTTYILAGLSSGTFINETYTYNYGTIQKTNTSVNSSLTNFYFAKTLNVSFGFGYPLSKINSLIIEPFLKYPLSGIGAQDLKFGAGGVNLKFSITSPKK